LEKFLPQNLEHALEIQSKPHALEIQENFCSEILPGSPPFTFEDRILQHLQIEAYRYYGAANQEFKNFVLCLRNPCPQPDVYDLLGTLDPHLLLPACQSASVQPELSQSEEVDPDVLPTVILGPERESFSFVVERKMPEGPEPITGPGVVEESDQSFEERFGTIKLVPTSEGVMFEGELESPVKTVYQRFAKMSCGGKAPKKHLPKATVETLNRDLATSRAAVKERRKRTKKATKK
jgi:hypothetical protein